MTQKKKAVPEISAAAFKARCLALIEEVKNRRTQWIITKRGKPMARIVPVDATSPMGSFEALRGTVVVHGDIIVPVDVVWDADG